MRFMGGAGNYCPSLCIWDGLSIYYGLDIPPLTQFIEFESLIQQSNLTSLEGAKESCPPLALIDPFGQTV